MTLLIARLDVFRQPSAAGKSPPDESPRRSGKAPYQSRQQFRILAGNLVWLWTLFAAVLAITLPALLNNNFSLSSPASVDGQKDRPLNEIAFEALCDAPATMRASRLPALEEDALAPTSLSYQGNTLEGSAVCSVLTRTLRYWTRFSL